MKKLNLMLTAAIAFSAVTGAVAQDKKQPDPKEIEKAMEAWAKVGKEHKQLQRLAGNWNCEVVSFMPDPSKPTKNKATAQVRMLLGGRYMQHQFRGVMDGKPFQGIGLLAYDNAQKKYVGSWIDNMGTGIMTTEGTYDPKSHTLTEIGTSQTPIGVMKMKMVSKYLSDDKYIFTMSMVAEGNPKIMEITYTRAKRTPKKKDGAKKGKKKDSDKAKDSAK